jgi:site-specific DNA-methyltransferase (adenine-specific)
MNLTDKITVTNEDNMELMSRYPENYFDLAIVDPPYGIGISGQKESKKGKKSDRKYHKQKDWDNAIPSGSYFNEVFRVSKDQIIWGANYFVEHLKKGTKGWVVWDKMQHGLTMSDCELAFSSFNKPTRVYYKNRVVLQQEGTIHPTQKPVKLYEWLLDNYAKEGNKILDTHLGSGSIAIACHNRGFELTACELDKEYFDNFVKRFKSVTAQQTLF